MLMAVARSTRDVLPVQQPVTVLERDGFSAGGARAPPRLRAQAPARGGRSEPAELAMSCRRCCCRRLANQSDWWSGTLRSRLPEHHAHAASAGRNPEWQRRRKIDHDPRHERSRAVYSRAYLPDSRIPARGDRRGLKGDTGEVEKNPRRAVDESRRRRDPSTSDIDRDRDGLRVRRHRDCANSARCSTPLRRIAFCRLQRTTALAGSATPRHRPRSVALSWGSAPDAGVSGEKSGGVISL